MGKKRKNKKRGLGSLNIYERGDKNWKGTAKNTAIDTVAAVLGGLTGSFIGKGSALVGVGAIGASHYFGMPELRALGAGMVTGVTAGALSGFGGFDTKEGIERSKAFLDTLKKNVFLNGIGSVRRDAQGRRIYMTPAEIAASEAKRVDPNIEKASFGITYENSQIIPYMTGDLRADYERIRTKILSSPRTNGAFHPSTARFTVGEAKYMITRMVTMADTGFLSLFSTLTDYVNRWQMGDPNWKPAAGSGVYLNNAEGRAQMARDNAAAKPVPFVITPQSDIESDEYDEEDIEGFGRKGSFSREQIRREAEGYYNEESPFGEIADLAEEIGEVYEEFTEHLLNGTLDNAKASQVLTDAKSILYDMDEVAQEEEIAGIGEIITDVIEDIDLIESAALNGLAGTDDLEQVMETIAGVGELVLAGITDDDDDDLDGFDDDDDLDGFDDDDDLDGFDDDDDLDGFDDDDDLDGFDDDDDLDGFDDDDDLDGFDDDDDLDF